MDCLFLASALFIAYTYFVYPLAIWGAARWRRTPPAAPLPDAQCPPVTLVIAGHNEAHRIAAKLQDITRWDYPQDRIDIVFVSDGSSDNTAEVLAGFPHVRFLNLPERGGKAQALNLALQTPCHEVILFNDVRQTAAPDAMRCVVSSLLQDGVGAVSGELTHHDPATATGASIGLYWRYEKWIRKSESDLASVVGATGAFYAIRRALFVPLQPGTLLDDFEIPMQVARQGHRVLFDPRALVYDGLQETMAGERTRKMRTLSGNFQSFVQQPWLFLPWHNPLWWQFLSHKVFRLLVPYAMILALLGSALSSTPLVQVAALAQAAFYAGAWAAHRHPRLRANKLLNVAMVFCELNWTALLAGLHFVRGQTRTGWDKT